MAQLDYTVNTDEQEQSFDAVPAGEYLAVIEESDYVPTKDGTGKILKLTYQIIDGKMKGRKLFENLNLENKNEQASQIARRSLNSIGMAVGVDIIKNSDQLHNKPMKIDVTVKDSAEYGKQNIIKKHLPVSGNPQETNVQESSPSTSAPVPPWNQDKK